MSVIRIVVLGLNISQKKDFVDGCFQKGKQMPLPRLLAQCTEISKVKKTTIQRASLTFTHPNCNELRNFTFACVSKMK